MKVIKRDGRKVAFDVSKIRKSLRGALIRCEEMPQEIFDRLVAQIVTAISEEESKYIHVEQINDIIELTLMEAGERECAREFVLFREEVKNIKANTVDGAAMQDYLFTSRYARYLPRKRRRENWNEAVNRVRDMHIKRYPMIEEDLVWAFEKVREKKVLPSMRSMQFGGAPIENKHARLYNCTYSVIDRPAVFSEILYLLLCGCGVGFSVEFHNVDKLPKLAPVLKDDDRDSINHIVIEDSIEGWADAMKALFQSYIDGTVVEFSYRKIRTRGSKIASGGRAPGHIPLRRSIEKIRLILDGALGRRLKPIEAYDIVMFLCDAVLAGGVRRCLPSNYEVKMSDGTYKMIADIKVGDEVYYNGTSYPVTNLFDNGEQSLIKIKTADGGYHESTPTHKWLVYNKLNKQVEWVMAKTIAANRNSFMFVKEK